MDPRLSPACQEADAAFTVPRCISPDYIDRLLAICAEERVSLLVPTIDPELAVLARSTERFAAVGTRVVVSSPDVVALANDKESTARVLKSAGVPVPETMPFDSWRARPESLGWPVLLKPIAGSASVGIRRLQHAGELASVPAVLPAFIAQECAVGREYTVNVFFSPAGQLQCAVPHERLEVRSGEVSKGRTVALRCLMDAAEQLAGALTGARGPLCFQAIVRDDGSFAVFEINARFGGGFPLAHQAGARFTKWLLEESLGRAPSYSREWRAGVTMLRYDAAVFLHEGE
ncbi:MAG: ATP-grasp domain-containing protein [Candidatus Didemnitutus sp.]|nr:ATP-grasp domain-containing protein [Candidatus Didemnitutus sp.]